MEDSAMLGIKNNNEKFFRVIAVVFVFNMKRVLIFLIFIFGCINVYSNVTLTELRQFLLLHDSCNCSNEELFIYDMLGHKEICSSTDTICLDPGVYMLHNRSVKYDPDYLGKYVLIISNKGIVAFRIQDVDGILEDISNSLELSDAEFRQLTLLLLRYSEPSYSDITLTELRRFLSLRDSSNCSNEELYIYDMLGHKEICSSIDTICLNSGVYMLYNRSVKYDPDYLGKYVLIISNKGIEAFRIQDVGGILKDISNSLGLSDAEFRQLTHFLLRYSETFYYIKNDTSPLRYYFKIR